MKERYIASVDQGTASSRCIVFDRAARIVSVSQKEHEHIFPRPGWVEHDPDEIWANVLYVIHDALAARSNESVRIGTLHEGQVLVVHHVFRPDDSRQALEVGSLVPAHATALGKMLLASHQYAAEELSAEGLTRYTGDTITDAHRLRRALEEIRRRGWAADVEELVEGEVSLAAPINDRRGVTVGAIGISGPIERLCENGEPRTELVSFVREAARAVSRDLGAIPW